MTRDEHRKACAEAIAKELWGRNEPGPSWQEYLPDAYAALDALHGIARVDPIDATEEMVTASGWSPHSHVKAGWLRMSATGNLTNPPKGNP